MTRPTPSLRLLALTLVGGVSALLPEDVAAQSRIDVGVLQLETPADCARLAPDLIGNESGGQWLIGSRIELFGLPGSRSSMQTLDGSFHRVSCYNDVRGRRAAVEERVFVAAVDGSFCGWVARDDLLEEHRNDTLDSFEGESDAVCETPRAMLFDRFCEELRLIASEEDDACRGVPPGLRAKGVLTGSTLESLIPRYPFMTAPAGGEVQGARQFFSVLEIHDVARGQSGRVMVLAGDGEGDMFGWIDRQAVELWPTRLGLFYDRAGLGRLFQRRRDLIANWRNGAPAADIAPGLDRAALEDYVHGNLPLLSYPIIRTVDPARDPLAADPSDVPYHEVIFLGQTGEGSASELMDEAEYARRFEAVQRLNVMLVVDTTESMLDYLPFMRTGINGFIRAYVQRSLDPANRLPDMRIAVHAYSDFRNRSRTGLSDPIRMEELMPPRRIGLGYDVSAALNRIANHSGLRDEAGLREEAALEAVAQLSDQFTATGAWFEDGPRVIIHIADHGSRDGVSLRAILGRLARNRTYYFPVAVLTDDQGDRDRTVAHEAFMDQAIAMLSLSGLVPNAEAGDVARIDLLDLETATADVVRDRLDLAMDEVIQLVFRIRADVIGEDLAAASERARDLASSRYLLDEALMEDFDLDRSENEVIVQASTGFAPLRMRERGRESVVEWTYTVSLEPTEARLLQQSFSEMCSQIGSPQQQDAFRRLIVRLAQAFSDDVPETDFEVRAILADLAGLPGAAGSFLAQHPNTLLQRADSTDPRVIEDLRRDVCWTSYHLNNMDARFYARPDQVVWAGREFVLRSGEEAIRRDYRYRPVIGADMVYLPSFFFVLPSVVETRQTAEEDCEFFCD